MGDEVEDLLWMAFNELAPKLKEKALELGPNPGVVSAALGHAIGEVVTEVEKFGGPAAVDDFLSGLVSVFDQAQAAAGRTQKLSWIRSEA